jgi:hypothetical protein
MINLNDICIMGKEKLSKQEKENKEEKEQNLPSQPENSILAKHRIKVLKNAGISKSNDHKKTITVVNPTSDLEKKGTEESGW